MPFRVPASVILLGLLTVTNASAQLYRARSAAAPYVPLVGATKVVTLGSTKDPDRHTGVATVPLGFSFPFYGKTFDTVLVHTNGVLLFEDSARAACDFSGIFDACSIGGRIPNATRQPHSFIAPWWLDGSGDAPGGEIRFLQRPSPGGDALASETVIEFFEWGYRRGSGAASYSFQVRLKADGSFQIHYGTHTHGAPSTTPALGWENADGSQGGSLVPCSAPGGGLSCAVTAWPGRRTVSNGLVGEETLFTVQVLQEPDLVVGEVGLAEVTSDAAGMGFTVRAQLRNLGKTAANGVKWKAFLSTNPTLDEGDTAILTSEALSLAGEQSLDVTGQANWPSPPEAGAYYLLVQVDSEAAVAEDSETNNVAASSSSFDVGANLVAQRLSGPQTSSPGAQEELTLNFGNLGLRPAPEFKYRLVLSADRVVDGSDIEVLTGVASLGGASSEERKVAVTLPASLPPGDYYWGLFLDTDNAFKEPNESNNHAWSITKMSVRLADLIAASVELIDPVSLAPVRVADLGGELSFRIRVRNDGERPVPAFKVAVVLSDDTNLSFLRDLIVAEPDFEGLAAAEAREVTVRFRLPVESADGMPLRSGPYYFFGLVDSTSQILESNEGNNSLGVNGAVLLRAPAPDYAVLRMEAPAHVAVSETFAVQRSFRNLGSVDGGPVVYRYYASANDIITTEDIPLLMVRAGAVHDSGTLSLSPGAEDRGMELLKLPPHAAAGRYFIGAIVDVAQAVVELDERNNALAAPTETLAAGAGLRILTQQLPDSVVSQPYLFRLLAVGGQLPTVWSLAQDGARPPPGLSLEADGTLTGLATKPGVHGFTVVATSGEQSVAARVVLRVLRTPTELAVTTRQLPPLVNEAGALYRAALGAAGGVRPYRWRLAEGLLPSGVVLESDGTFTGSPAANTVVGERALRLEVQDSLGSRAWADVKLRIVEPGALVIASLSVPDALVNDDYAADLVAANVDAPSLARPLHWSLVSGALPAGLLLSTVGGERGVVRGVPTEAGTFAFTVQVTDAQGRADVADLVLRVFPRGLEVRAVEPYGKLLPGEEVEIVLTTGVASSRYSLYSGQLPNGLVLDSSGVIRGVVSEDASAGTYNLAIEAVAPSGGAGLGALALEVGTREENATGCSSTGGALWAGVFATLAAIRVTGRRRAKGVSVAGALVLAVLAAAGEAGAQETHYSLVAPYEQPFVSLGNAQTVNVTADTSATVPLPFGFSYFGTTYGNVTISYNGYVAFSGSGVESVNPPIPDGSDGAATMVVAPWWDTFAGGGTTRYAVRGNPPQRVFIVEWTHAYAQSQARFSFQVQLHESSNQIRFAYPVQRPPGALGHASVGLQGRAAEGMAGLSCTTQAEGVCSAEDWPAGRVLEFRLRPDLVVSEPNAVDRLYAGVPSVLSATVQNLGGQDAEATTVRFYLSRDPEFAPDADVLLGEGALETLGFGQAQPVSASVTVPGGTEPGTYFLFAVAEPVGEQDEANNVSARRVVTVGPATADLVVAQLLLEPGLVRSPGQSVRVTRTLRNAGNAATGAFPYTYFLSDNAQASPSDHVLSSALSTGLQSSAQDEAVVELALPSSGLSPGEYFIGVCVDYEATQSPAGTVEEISEVNNCVTSEAPFLLDTGALAILTGELPPTVQFGTYGLVLRASGASGRYAWSVVSGSMPPGLTLREDGQLRGSPTAAGTFAFTVKVTAGGAERTRELVLEVGTGAIPLAIVDQELPGAEFAAAYGERLVAVGGRPPYVWRLMGDSRLPKGMALSSDGRVEGRPFAAGEYPFVVELTDAVGTSVRQGLSLRIIEPTHLSIATAHHLPNGSIGRSYPYTPLQAVGGSGQYVWTVLSFQRLSEPLTEAPGIEEPSIPGGFGLVLDRSSAGVAALVGAPQQGGLFALKVRVVDVAAAGGAAGCAQLQAGGATGGLSLRCPEDTKTFLLRVSYEQALAITTLALPDAFIGKAYTGKIQHNGAGQDVRFAVPCVQQAQPAASGFTFECAERTTAEALPPGLTLNADGTIEGSPTSPEGGAPEPLTYSFLVKAVDAQGRQDVRALSIRVRPDVAVEEGCSTSNAGAGWAWLSVIVLLAFKPRNMKPLLRSGFPVLSLLLVLLSSGCGGGDNRCEDVRCGGNQTCDPEDGQCKCGGRGGNPCAEGLTCDLSSATCVSSLCPDTKLCAAGTSCDALDGLCKCGGTGGEQCAEGQVCNPDMARCEPAKSCAEVACPANQTCDAETGACECGGVTCATGERCEATPGGFSCVADACTGVTCAGATSCDPADGQCKCNGQLCGAGQMCGCGDGPEQSCEPTERSCQASTLCENRTCAGGSTCDPVDGLCKCGGPGGPTCGEGQVCHLALGQCQGGSQCTLPDGSAKICPAGLSCDPENGKCTCGGRGGAECRAPSGADAGEVCVSNFIQTACMPRCEPTRSECPESTFCYFDPTSTGRVSYCAQPTAERGEGQTCSAPTDCFIQSPAPISLHCSGLTPEQAGYCRTYCNPLAGDAECPQFPQAHTCERIPEAPLNVGVCVARGA